MDFNSHKPLCDSIAEDLIGVITTAGYYPNPVRVMENSEETIKCINVNFLGLCSMINIISNIFENRKKGFIVGISSVSGGRGRQKNYIYGSAKSAFSTYLSGLRQALSKTNINVITVHPGFVKTQFGKNNSGLASLAIKFLMNFFAISVEEGAETIVFLATDNSVKNITGKYFYQSKIKEPSIFAQSQKDADLLWDISLRIVKNKGLTLT